MNWPEKYNLEAGLLFHKCSASWGCTHYAIAPQRASVFLQNNTLSLNIIDSTVSGSRSEWASKGMENMQATTLLKVNKMTTLIHLWKIKSQLNIYRIWYILTLFSTLPIKPWHNVSLSRRVLNKKWIYGTDYTRPKSIWSFLVDLGLLLTVRGRKGHNHRASRDVTFI